MKPTLCLVVALTLCGCASSKMMSLPVPTGSDRSVNVSTADRVFHHAGAYRPATSDVLVVQSSATTYAVAPLRFLGKITIPIGLVLVSAADGIEVGAMRRKAKSVYSRYSDKDPLPFQYIRRRSFQATLTALRDEDFRPEHTDGRVRVTLYPLLYLVGQPNKTICKFCLHAVVDYGSKSPRHKKRVVGNEESAVRMGINAGRGNKEYRITIEFHSSAHAMSEWSADQWALVSDSTTQGINEAAALLAAILNNTFNQVADAKDNRKICVECWRSDRLAIVKTYPINERRPPLPSGLK